MLQAHLGITTL